MRRFIGGRHGVSPRTDQGKFVFAQRVADDRRHRDVAGDQRHVHPGHTRPVRVDHPPRHRGRRQIEIDHRLGSAVADGERPPQRPVGQRQPVRPRRQRIDGVTPVVVDRNDLCNARPLDPQRLTGDPDRDPIDRPRHPPGQPRRDRQVEIGVGRLIDDDVQRPSRRHPAGGADRHVVRSRRDAVDDVITVVVGRRRRDQHAAPPQIDHGRTRRVRVDRDPAPRDRPGDRTAGDVVHRQRDIGDGPARDDIDPRPATDRRTVRPRRHGDVAGRCRIDRVPSVVVGHPGRRPGVGHRDDVHPRRGPAVAVDDPPGDRPAAGGDQIRGRHHGVVRHGDVFDHRVDETRHGQPQRVNACRQPDQFVPAAGVDFRRVQLAAGFRPHRRRGIVPRIDLDDARRGGRPPDDPPAGIDVHNQRIVGGPGRPVAGHRHQRRGPIDRQHALGFQHPIPRRDVQTHQAVGGRRTDHDGRFDTVIGSRSVDDPEQPHRHAAGGRARIDVDQPQRHVGPRDLDRLVHQKLRQVRRVVGHPAGPPPVRRRRVGQQPHEIAVRVPGIGKHAAEDLIPVLRCIGRSNVAGDLVPIDRQRRIGVDDERLEPRGDPGELEIETSRLPRQQHPRRVGPAGRQKPDLFARHRRKIRHRPSAADRCRPRDEHGVGAERHDRRDQIRPAGVGVLERPERRPARPNQRRDGDRRRQFADGRRGDAIRIVRNERRFAVAHPDVVDPRVDADQIERRRDDAGIAATHVPRRRDHVAVIANQFDHRLRGQTRPGDHRRRRPRVGTGIGRHRPHRKRVPPRTDRQRRRHLRPLPALDHDVISPRRCVDDSQRLRTAATATAPTGRPRRRRRRVEVRRRRDPSAGDPNVGVKIDAR